MNWKAIGATLALTCACNSLARAGEMDLMGVGLDTTIGQLTGYGAALTIKDQNGVGASFTIAPSQDTADGVQSVYSVADLVGNRTYTDPITGDTFSFTGSFANNILSLTSSQDFNATTWQDYAGGTQYWQGFFNQNIDGSGSTQIFANIVPVTVPSSTSSGPNDFVEDLAGGIRNAVNGGMNQLSDMTGLGLPIIMAILATFAIFVVATQLLAL